MQHLFQEEIIKIQPKGVITIPKHLRTSLGLLENGLARLKSEKGRLIIEPVYTLPYPVRTYSDSEVEEFFALDEKDSKELRRIKLLP